MAHSNKRSKYRKFAAIDLFSGCGGLTEGLKRAGFRVRVAIETDPLAISTYRRNHPEVHIYSSDIRRITAKDVAKKLRLRKGGLALIAACPPCQAFSTMRTLNKSRRIVDPEQKNLLHEVLRFARVLRPQAVMVENVPGLKNDHRWGRFVAELRKLGYHPKSRVLDAAEYGVPQRRRRLLLLASRLGIVPFARPGRRQRTVRETIASLPAPSKCRDPLHKVVETRSLRIKQLIRSVPSNGGSRAELPKRFQLRCHKLCNGFKDVYGRMRWSDVAPTITGGCTNPSKGRFLHPERHRAITLREAASLQSFRRRYWISLDEGKFRAAELIGNALPPEFVKRHAKATSNYLKKKSARLSKAAA